MLRKPINVAGREKLERMKGELQGALPPLFHPEESVSVYIDQYAITDATSKTPVVGSCDALPCLLIGLYDSKNKRAGCAHASISSDVQSLENMVKFFSIPDTVAHLMGGNEHLELCLDVVEFLEKKGIRIVNAQIDYLKAKGILASSPKANVLDSASMAIDARTGNLYSPVAFELNFDRDIAIMKSLSSFHSLQLKPMEEIFNSITTKATTESKQQPLTQETPSFHGLQAGFLNSKPKAAVSKPKVVTPTTSTSSEPAYSGLKVGFLNNPRPQAATPLKENTKSTKTTTTSYDSSNPQYSGLKGGFLNRTHTPMPKKDSTNQETNRLTK